MRLSKSPGQVLYEEVHGGPLQAGHKSWEQLTEDEQLGYAQSAARIVTAAFEYARDVAEATGMNLRD